jgi:hypothetical protein
MQVEWPDFQVWWQLAKTEIENILSGQQGQIDTINAIIDPNTLTPDKKPIWIFMETYLTGEQSDIDAKATSYGITTEKTAYDNAISALTTYLATLTTDVLWSDTSGNTTIVDTTFRSKFTDVLTKKQALMNKMQASAKTLADAAQTTANTRFHRGSIGTAAANRRPVTRRPLRRPPTRSTATTASRRAGPRQDPFSALRTPAASATITISAHTRKYTDVSSVSVNGGSITGLSYSTSYAVYYDQTSRAGGAVTYHATTDPNVALPNAAAGRHFCGKILTPAAAGAATSGGVSPPGGGGAYTYSDPP